MAKQKTPPVLDAKSHPRVDLAPTKRAMKARSVGPEASQVSQYQAPGLVVPTE